MQWIYDEISKLSAKCKQLLDVYITRPYDPTTQKYLKQLKLVCDLSAFDDGEVDTLRQEFKAAIDKVIKRINHNRLRKIKRRIKRLDSK